jgi:alpha-beta hydrolase superfamily lysophospholipase
MLLRVVLYAIMAYIALTAVVFFLQRQLLYLPRVDHASERAAQAIGLTFWPASGQDYRGFIGTGRSDDAKGTVMIFHGNAGAAMDRTYYVRALEPLGYRVLLMEYPGYGGRTGKPSEKRLTRDARTSIERAAKEFGQPIFLWGESLGGGVVAAVVSDPTLPVAALILLTPWDSLPSLAQTLYWYLPARWLVRDKFDNVSNLQAFTGRVAIVLAERDDIIPKRHGLRLYTSLTGRKQLWCFPHAGHNSWPSQSTASWWREVMDFVAESNGH